MIQPDAPFFQFTDVDYLRGTAYSSGYVPIGRAGSIVRERRIRRAAGGQDQPVTWRSISAIALASAVNGGLVAILDL